MAQSRDTSSVCHVDMFDAEYRASFYPATPWIFETDKTIQAFATEEEACAEQRQHRQRHGFNPMTGEPA